MTTFADLRDANIRRNKEWVPDEPLSITFRATELAGESGEACNAIKKIERERLGLKGSRATLDDLAEELADTVICCDLIAMDTGIDLGAAIERKFDASSVKNGLETRFTRTPSLEVTRIESWSSPASDPMATEIRFSALVDRWTSDFISEFKDLDGRKMIAAGDKIDDLAAAKCSQLGLVHYANRSDDGSYYVGLTSFGRSLWVAIKANELTPRRVSKRQIA